MFRYFLSYTNSSGITSAGKANFNIVPSAIKNSFNLLKQIVYEWNEDMHTVNERVDQV